MRTRVVLILALIVAAAGALGAQERRDTIRLAPVVVTATRVPTPLSTLSATVTVLDGETLQREGIRDVAEALRRAAGLTVVRSGSYGAVTSVFVRGGESDYIKVLLDGVPLNDPGGAVDLANLTTDNVQRIEIVRGPVSVLYGSDAVAGVIQILTRRGRGAPRAAVGFRGGTFGSFTAEADVRGGTDAVEYGFAFSRATTDGIHPFNSDYDNTVLSGSVRARPDDRTEATLSLRYADSEFHFPTDGAGNVVDQNARRLEERVTGSLEVGRFFAHRLEGRLLLTLNETDGGFDDPTDGPADTLGFYGFRSVQALHRRGADGRVLVHLGRSHVLTVGAQVEEQTERTSTESQSEFGAFMGSTDAARVNRGYYVQVQAPLGSLSLTAGARLDDNETFGTFFTYRAGAVYAFPVGTRLWASVGKAFKEPTFVENFSDSPFARGNPALEPERTTSWEVGAEHAVAGGRARIGATYFSQRFRDLIDFTFTPPNPGDPNYFNVPAADARGVELHVEAVPIPPLRLTGSYTRLETNVVDAGFEAGPAAQFIAGQRLLRRPTTAYTVGASYRLLDRARLWSIVHRVGEREDVDFRVFTRQTLAGYTRVDVAAEVEPWRARRALRHAALLVRIDNLLDARYAEVLNFPAPGRAVTLGGRLRF